MQVRSSLLKLGAEAWSLSEGAETYIYKYWKKLYFNPCKCDNLVIRNIRQIMKFTIQVLQRQNNVGFPFNNTVAKFLEPTF